jgi:hypothetical protein
VEGVNTTRGHTSKVAFVQVRAMNGEIRELVTDEPIQFCRLPIKNQNFRQFIKPLQAMNSQPADTSKKKIG